MQRKTQNRFLKDEEDEKMERKMPTIIIKTIINYNIIDHNQYLFQQNY